MEELRQEALENADEIRLEALKLLEETTAEERDIFYSTCGDVVEYVRFHQTPFDDNERFVTNMKRPLLEALFFLEEFDTLCFNALLDERIEGDDEHV